MIICLLICIKKTLVKQPTSNNFTSEEIKNMTEKEKAKYISDLINDAYKYFIIRYSENKDYYYLYIYYEQIIKNIIDAKKQQGFLTITELIKSHMSSMYNTTKINKNSNSKKIIEGAISLIFQNEGYFNKEYISLNEFVNFIYNNKHIKLYINIVKSNSGKYNSLLLFSLINKYNEITNTISIKELKAYYKLKNTSCKKIDSLTKVKLNNIIKKFIDRKSNINIIN